LELSPLSFEYLRSGEEEKRNKKKVSTYARRFPLNFFSPSPHFSSPAIFFRTQFKYTHVVEVVVGWGDGVDGDDGGEW